MYSIKCISQSHCVAIQSVAIVSIYFQTLPIVTNRISIPPSNTNSVFYLPAASSKPHFALPV